MRNIIKNKKIQRYITFANDLAKLKDKTIAIYGTGQALHELIDNFDFSDINIYGLIDRDEGAIGKIIRSYKVYKLDEVRGLVDSIVIASNSAWDTIYDRIKFVEAEGIAIVKSSFIDNTIFDFVEEDYFRIITDEDRAKVLFKNAVTRVIVEVSSFCNRRCWFCPNSYLDRFSSNNRLDVDVYSKLLHELAEINYSGLLSFAGSNEPLADKIIVKRIEEARALLPNAKISINTNGDYLTREYLEELRIAGLDVLKIQAYFEKNEQFCSEAVFSKIDKTAANLDLSYDVSHRPDIDQWFEAQFKYNGVDIVSYGRDFNLNGHYRGGLIDVGLKRVRTAPCLYPFRDFPVHYDGNVTPCCNIRPDAPEHKKYIIGNLRNKTIYEIYTQSEILYWRKQLFNYSLKEIDVCINCDFETEKYERYSNKSYFENNISFKLPQ